MLLEVIAMQSPGPLQASTVSVPTEQPRSGTVPLASCATRLWERQLAAWVPFSLLGRRSGHLLQEHATSLLFTASFIHSKSRGSTYSGQYDHKMDEYLRACKSGFSALVNICLASCVWLADPSALSHRLESCRFNMVDAAEGLTWKTDPNKEENRFSCPRTARYLFWCYFNNAMFITTLNYVW